MVVKTDDIIWEDLGNGLKRKIMASGGKIMSVEVSFTKGAIGAIHTHPHQQISYILEGSFNYELKGKVYKLKTGDTCYVAPGEPHGVVSLEGNSRILDLFTPQREDFIKK